MEGVLPWSLIGIKGLTSRHWHGMTLSRGRFMDLHDKRYIWKTLNDATSVSFGELDSKVNAPNE